MTLDYDTIFTVHHEARTGFKLTVPGTRRRAAAINQERRISMGGASTAAAHLRVVGDGKPEDPYPARRDRGLSGVVN